MSHATDIAEDVSLPSTPARIASPSRPSTPVENLETASPGSLRSWTILKIAAKLRRRGIPYPETARKAELCRLLNANPDTPRPGTSTQATDESTPGIQATMSALLSSVNLINERLEKLENQVAIMTPAAILPTLPQKLPYA
ncbi:Hypothetical predicted protein, partial [Pelobates cultripes]